MKKHVSYPCKGTVVLELHEKLHHRGVWENGGRDP